MICAAASARADGLPIKLVSINGIVAPGETVTLVIQTSPGAACAGKRQGHFGNAYSVPLAPETTDANGKAQWLWPVLGGTHPIGLRGVRVTCTAGTQSGTLDTTFNVQ